MTELNLHDVQIVEILQRSGSTSHWTSFIFHCKDGSKLEVNAFAERDGIRLFLGEAE